MFTSSTAIDPRLRKKTTRIYININENMFNVKRIVDMHLFISRMIILTKKMYSLTLIIGMGMKIDTIFEKPKKRETGGHLKLHANR